MLAKNGYNPGRQLKVIGLAAAQEAFLSRFAAIGGQTTATDAKRLNASSEAATVKKMQSDAFSKTKDFSYSS